MGQQLLSSLDGNDRTSVFISIFGLHNISNIPGLGLGFWNEEWFNVIFVYEVVAPENRVALGSQPSHNQEGDPSRDRVGG